MSVVHSSVASWLAEVKLLDGRLSVPAAATDRLIDEVRTTGAVERVVTELIALAIRWQDGAGNQAHDAIDEIARGLAAILQSAPAVDVERARAALEKLGVEASVRPLSANGGANSLFSLRISKKK